MASEPSVIMSASKRYLMYIRILEAGFNYLIVLLMYAFNCSFLFLEDCDGTFFFWSHKVISEIELNCDGFT